MKNICTTLIICAMAFGAFAVQAADYPTKPSQLVCPYSAGGLTDIVARFVARKMAENLGQPIIVVNKPGAGSSIASSYVAAAKPDGYTVLINMTGGFVVTPLITPNLPYKMSDFTPIGKIASADYLLLVNKDLPVNTIAELVAYTKKNPGKLSYGSPGVGSVNHLVMEQLVSQVQIDMQHIPYTSELPVMTALMGGHIQAAAVTAPTSYKYVTSNQVRAVAALAEKRDSVLSGLATSGEQGFPDLLCSVYNVLVVLSKTPAPIVKKLEAALLKTLADKEVAANLEKMGFKVDRLGAADTKAFLDKEAKKWASVVKKANMTIK